MKTDTLIVQCYAVLFILFSLPAFFMPEAFAAALQFSLDLPGAKMEFMAAYGGLIGGFGVFLALTAKANVRMGLMAILCSMGGLFLGRLGGLFVDNGTTAIQLTFLVLELLTVVIVVSRIKRTDQMIVSAT